jgi:hypothetical protein
MPAAPPPTTTTSVSLLATRYASAIGKSDDCFAIVQRPSNLARAFALADDGTERIVMGVECRAKQRARQHGRRALLLFHSGVLR